MRTCCATLCCAVPLCVMMYVMLRYAMHVMCVMYVMEWNGMQCNVINLLQCDIIYGMVAMRIDEMK